MKKYIIITIATILVVCSACKKSWLEIIPQGQLVASTVNDYEKIMNTPSLYLAQAGGWQEMQLMGDEIAAETPFFSNLNASKERFFQWADTTWPANVSFAAMALTYGESVGHTKIMFLTNKVISEVMNATTGTEAQKKAVLAEAKATRAWSLFNISNFYCKPYSAATAATDPGMPFSTKADVTQTDFSRGTLQETYDFIVNDLQDALEYISMKQDHVTRMSKPAVEGLLGKVYMFMGKYAEALPLLNAAMADVLANGQAVLYDYNETLAPGGAFTPIDPFSGPLFAPTQNFTDVTESILFKVYASGPGYTSPWGSDGLVLTPEAQSLYGAGDLRLLLYTDLNPDFSPNPAGRLRKYTLQFSRFGLQLPELYLLQAECKARMNDLPGAVTAVETLRRNRMPVADAGIPAAIAGNKTALVKFIFDERIREFAMEGMRWFDMRRQSVDPLFAGITFKHTMFNDDGTTTVFTLRQPNRLVLKWPGVIILTNPNLPDNP